MNIQWFPGHMTKTKRMIAESIKLCDCVIELCDARCPQSSRNPELPRLIGDKKLLLVINKSDIADPVQITAKIRSSPPFQVMRTPNFEPRGSLSVAMS